jgi:hypothetical protein
VFGGLTVLVQIRSVAICTTHLVVSVAGVGSAVAAHRARFASSPTHISYSCDETRCLTIDCPLGLTLLPWLANP